MGQLGIRIINIALFTTSCFFSAAVFNHVAESLLAPDYVSAFQPVVPSEAKPPSWEERNQILERNLFRAKVAATGSSKSVPEPPPPEEEAQLTKLPIELLGTLAGEPASLSSAVIQNTREKKHQVVRVGDTLKAFAYVTVTSIEPRRVLLRNRDITEELLLVKTKPGAGSRAKPGRTPLQRMKSRGGRVDRKRARAAKSAKARQDAANDQREERLQRLQNGMAQELMGDLEPAYDEDGKIHGVLVGNVGAGGLLARAGLEAEDVIESLNGIAINSAGAAARVLRELSKCKPMTGSVRGPSGKRTLKITQSLLAEMNCPN